MEAVGLSLEVNTIAKLAKGMAVACLALLCDCTTVPTWYVDDPGRPDLPAQTSFNSGAGRGDSLFVTLNTASGEELVFCVDTGSPVTILDKSLEPTLGRRMETKKVQYGWFAEATVGIYGAPKLFLGKVQLLTGERVWTDDLSHKSLRHSIKGVLGMDCLRHYCVQLDFVALELRFLDPERLNRGALGRPFPLSISRVGVTVNGSLVDARGQDSGIDTAEYMDGALNPTLFRREVERKEEVLMRDWRDSAGVLLREARLTQGVFAGEFYPDVIVREHPNGGNLVGLRFLARHLVTFNFPKRTMYLKRTSIGPLATRRTINAYMRSG